MRTVELIPDPALEETVRDVWRRLRAAGLPSLADHPHPTNRPHLTLATADQLAGGVTAALTGLPVDVVLDGTTVFDGKAGVLAWRIDPDDALLALHARVWAALDGLDRNPLHAPGSWVPHVSLALRTKPEHRAAALEILRDLPPARGALVSARSYDYETRGLLQLA